MWIWSRNTDLSVFAGSAVVALAVGLSAPWLAPNGGVPPWAWIAFVLVLDVAHVWSTLFRTYLDGEELRRRRTLYFALPLGCYVAGVALHVYSAMTFWRVLAYIAVFHFVRQQVGWVAIYRARAGERERIDRWLDNAVVYAATGWPLLWWHANLPRDFHWFVADDFVAISPALVVPAGVLYGALLVAYVARSLTKSRINVGKHVVVVTTAAIWYVGIVAVNQDFTFTITNVTVHAIPYFALLWAYARERSKERPGSVLAKIVGGGLAAFFAVALGLAFCEELLWDRLVWHERAYLFGSSSIVLEDALDLVVPLLALPQLTHYALDGVLWRAKDAGPAQARALGFRLVEG